MRVVHLCTLFIRLSFIIIALIGVVGLAAPVARAAVPGGNGPRKGQSDAA